MRLLLTAWAVPQLLSSPPPGLQLDRLHCDAIGTEPVLAKAPSAARISLTHFRCRIQVDVKVLSVAVYPPLPLERELLSEEAVRASRATSRMVGHHRPHSMKSKTEEPLLWLQQRSGSHAQNGPCAYLSRKRASDPFWL